MSGVVSQADVATRLRDEVNWNYFFTLRHALGQSLNGPKYRFIKSDLLELAIDVFGGDAIQWVNGKGCDHLLDGHVRLEMKHHENSLYTKTGRAKPYVGQVRMQNTLGGGTSRVLHDTFDFLLITDRASAGIVSFSRVRRATKATSDAIVIKSKALRTAAVDFIVRPEDVTIRDVILEPVLEALHSRYRDFLDDVRRRFDEGSPSVDASS
jgi:hypothetical protein